MSGGKKSAVLAKAVVEDKKGHVCPKSDATHPRDRWETMFVYSFIRKFSNGRSKIEGLDSPMECVPMLYDKRRARS